MRVPFLENLTLKFNLSYNFKRILNRFYFNTTHMETNTKNNVQIIDEGLATVKTAGKVFYNPVQEFNRDLSISVLTAFVKNYETGKQNKKKPIDTDGVNVKNAISEVTDIGVKYDSGVTILEALSATGLRSIRYAKEVPGIKQIIANDISEKAVDSIKQNIIDNNVTELVTASFKDAIILLHQHKYQNSFDIIDLDPYGCPSIFLDSAVQAVKEGGLLLVTATDMAVLAGNSPETCHSKYGSISLRIKSCHEMALRILLQCIEAHANRYGRYIQPLLSISADFYIRVFVRVFDGAQRCKYTLSKLSFVYHCTGCDSFALQPLGIVKRNEKNNQDKFGLPTNVPVDKKCEHCGQSYHVGGPIWSAAIHDKYFVNEVLNNVPKHLKTVQRIDGVLNVILEELEESPLYYTLERLSGTLHVETPPMLTIRSAILNAGYKVSYTHCHKSSIKTDAPSKVIWDIMRCWVAKHPISKKRMIEGTAVCNILSKESEREYSFEMHPEANPESKKRGLVRFQANPLPFWGPGTRATAMVGEEKIPKSRRNQGKRKREVFEEESDVKENV